MLARNRIREKVSNLRTRSATKKFGFSNCLQLDRRVFHRDFPFATNGTEKSISRRNRDDKNKSISRLGGGFFRSNGQQLPLNASVSIVSTNTDPRWRDANGVSSSHCVRPSTANRYVRFFSSHLGHFYEPLFEPREPTRSSSFYFYFPRRRQKHSHGWSRGNRTFPNATTLIDRLWGSSNLPFNSRTNSITFGSAFIRKQWTENRSRANSMLILLFVMRLHDIYGSSHETNVTPGPWKK